MNLQQEYKETTGLSPTDTINGFIAYTDDYVEWLELEITIKKYL